MELLPFQTKAAKPMWQILYDAIKDYSYGHEFSWEQLKILTGFDKKVVSSIIHFANKRLLNNHKKCLVSVRNFGYKIGTVQEQEALGKRRKPRAIRQLNKGVLELENLDFSQLDDSQKVLIMHKINHYQTAIRYCRSQSLAGIKHGEKSVRHGEKSVQEGKKSIEFQKEVLKFLDDSTAKLRNFEEELKIMKAKVF